MSYAINIDITLIQKGDHVLLRNGSTLVADGVKPYLNRDNAYMVKFSNNRIKSISPLMKNGLVFFDRFTDHDVIDVWRNGNSIF